MLGHEPAPGFSLKPGTDTRAERPILPPVTGQQLKWRVLPGERHGREESGSSFTLQRFSG